MIPRRDISMYSGLFKYFFLHIKNFFFKKNYSILFEKSLQEHFSKENIFLFNHGRSTLNVIFDIVSIKKGDEIIIPNYYLKELIPLIKKRHLSLIFCDINKKNLSLDLGDVLSKITPKTKFVLLVHTFGFCQDMDNFMKEVRRKKRDIIVIEDCAHAFGSEYKNRKLGTFGDFSFFSFNYIKPLNLLSGGLLIVNSNKYYQKSRDVYKKIKNSSPLETINKIFRYYFMQLVLKTPSFVLIKFLLRKEKTKEIIKKIHKTPSKKVKTRRLSEFQSMLGCYELETFHKKQKKIEKNLSCYKKNLNTSLWERQPSGYNSKWSKYFLTFIAKNPSREVEEFMFKNKIDIGIEDEILDICKKNEDFPVSKKIYGTIFQIPLHHNLREKEIEKITKTLNSFFGNESS